MLDLQLGTDSLTGNRYLFAGANPMSFYEDGHGPFGRLKKIAKRAMPVLAYVPIVSTAIDVASAATGRDFYDGGRKMTGAERLTILGGAALGLIPGAGIAAKIGLKQAIKATTKAKPASKIDNAVGAACPIRRHSFLAGTLVLLADGTTKPIEEVAVGDEVLATDPETGETAAKPVTDLLGSQGLKRLVAITVDGDTDGPLIATGIHPFWVDGRGWTDAEDLYPGEQLRQADGDLVAVRAVRMWDQADTRVYNFTVADLHTYYVLADEPVLVHNAGGKDPCGQGAAEAGPAAVRNAHLAGSKHPVTGVPFNDRGFPDFSAFRHSEVGDVRIELTGSRGRDFAAANRAAGLSRTPSGYTWHHHQDSGLMQLIRADVHRATGHTGGFSRGRNGG
jgi:hypothetical protein